MSSGTYFSVPGVASVKWDAENDLVLVVWEGWANSTEFLGLLNAEIRALIENRGSKLLADCRLQRVLNPADQERANQEWIPNAARAGLKRFAIVLPVSELAAAHQAAVAPAPAFGAERRTTARLSPARSQPRVHR